MMLFASTPFVREQLGFIVNSLALTRRFYGRVIRVRRRGFHRDIRRGNQIQWPASKDGKASVVRRSRHSLWLEIDQPVYGPVNTIQVRLPQRYSA